MISVFTSHIIAQLTWSKIRKGTRIRKNTREEKQKCTRFVITHVFV